VTTTTTTTEAEVTQAQDLRELYAASYARLVGVVGAVCQDRDEAEEAVQEAFVRLMGSWTKVSRYDDPEAWVRKVALRQVSNRRRKALNGLRAALKHGPLPDVPEPSPATPTVPWRGCPSSSAPSWCCTASGSTPTRSPMRWVSH
jgi:RNA polymerase sigma-70 factor (ECF subfamily)